VDTTGDLFAATIRGQHLTDRRATGATLQGALADALTEARMRRSTDEVVGQLGGVDLRLRSEPGWDIAAIEFAGLPLRRLEFDRGELARSDALGLTRQVEHRLHSLPAVRDAGLERIGVIDTETESLAELGGRPFEGSARLANARRRLQSIDVELSASTDDALSEEAHPDLTDAEVRSNSPNASLQRAVGHRPVLPTSHVSVGIIGG
jgi:hypothetical protein